MKLKALFETHKAEPEAARLSKLLEDAGMAPMGEADAAPPEGDAPSSADHISAAIQGMVLGVLKDDSLDKTAKLGKIRQILGVEEKLTEKPAAPPEAPPADAAVAESLKTITTELASLKLAGKKAELLEAQGLTRSKLPASVRTQLDAAKTEAEATTLLESLPPSVRGGDKPRVGPKVLTESEEGDTYEALRDKVRGKPRQLARTLNG